MADTPSVREARRRERRKTLACAGRCGAAFVIAADGSALLVAALDPAARPVLCTVEALLGGVLLGAAVLVLTAEVATVVLEQRDGGRP